MTTNEKCPVCREEADELLICGGCNRPCCEGCLNREIGDEGIRDFCDREDCTGAPDNGPCPEGPNCPDCHGERGSVTQLFLGEFLGMLIILGFIAYGSSKIFFAVHAMLENVLSKL